MPNDEELPSRIENVERMLPQSKIKKRRKRVKSGRSRSYQSRVSRNYAKLFIFVLPVITIAALAVLSKQRTKNSNFTEKVVQIPKKIKVTLGNNNSIQETQIDEAQVLLRNFIQAQTWEERGKYVNDHSIYEENIKTFPPITFNDIPNEKTGVINVNGNIYLISTLEKDNTVRYGSVLNEDGILRVDWRAFVVHCTKTYQELISNEPKEAILRVRMEEDNYYNFAFDDDSKWKVYRATHPSWDTALYFYYPKDRSLPLYLRDSAIIYFVTVRVSSNSENSTRKQFIIEEFLGEGWTGFGD